MFENIKNKLSIHFPKLQIKFKDQSVFMKILGTILFFNKNYMTSFTTTIGNTVYFPTEQFVRTRAVSSFIILMHELVHISDSRRYNPFLFGFLYLFPQCLFLFSIPLFFLSWKAALLMLVFLAPIPSYFRMNFERRAYLVSLYVMHRLNLKGNYNINLDKQKEFFLSSFKNSSYYFMWPFNNLDKQFDAALIEIREGQRPYSDSVFDQIDSVMEDY